MARIPTVGTRGLGIAKISPRARKILAGRSRRAAKREFAPVLRADRAAFQGINRDYGREVQSVRGATDMAQQALSQALQGARSSGLTGKYLGQVAQEIGARKADAAQSIPFLLSEARDTRTDALGEARQQLLTHQAEKQQSALSSFDQLLKEARDKAAATLKERQHNREEDEPGIEYDPRAVNNAKLAVKAGYRELLGNSGKWLDANGDEVDPGTEGAVEIHPPRTQDEWRSFILRTAGVEGADPTDVAKAVQELREHIQRQVHRGNLKPLGIRFPLETE